MKKSKILLCAASLVLCLSIFCCVFSLSVFKTPTTADITVKGVTGKFQKIGENILDLIYPETTLSDNVHSNNTLVYIGGYPIGLKLYADGVIIVGTEPIDTKDGNVNAADKAGLKIGDIIKKINGKQVYTNSQASQEIENNAGKEISFEILRDGKKIDITFTGAFSVSENKYKAGIWIRDSSAGIGTVTFCTQDGRFASLGHAVCDVDTKQTLPISQGECTKAKITGLIKGQVGTAGELCGYLESEKIGEIYSNQSIGVYGEFDTLPENCSLYVIAKPEEIVTGNAKILTTLENGVKEEFNVKIEKINADDTGCKHLVVKVTDDKLLEKTGGIIQGMSGSPIIQNGKIIGAITHVLVDDPTRGYGIFAQTMLDTAQAVLPYEYKNAS